MFDLLVRRSFKYFFDLKTCLSHVALHLLEREKLEVDGHALDPPFVEVNDLVVDVKVE